jgi:hypothetical protein
MGRIEKTVFISYRRTTDEPWGLAIFQNLTQHGYDVFIDYDGIASFQFETVILENIRARAHFLVLLTPAALAPRSEPVDWMRREIEAALDSKRNIVPVMLDGFKFDKADPTNQLTGGLEALRRYNGLEIPSRFFVGAMERLHNKFLNVPVDVVLHSASVSARQVATEQKDKAEVALHEESQRKGVEERLRHEAVEVRRAQEEELRLREAFMARAEEIRHRLEDQISQAGRRLEKLEDQISQAERRLEKQPKIVAAVEFGVSHQASIQVNVPFIVNAHVFCPEDREAVAQRAMQQEARFLSRGAAAIARKSKITVRLNIDSCDVRPASHVILWTGIPVNVSFAATPHVNAMSTDKVIGTCPFFTHGLRIGQVLFELSLTRAHQGGEKSFANGRLINSAFASYASKDRRRVLARVQGLEKLGVYVYVDVRNLKSGDLYLF